MNNLELKVSCNSNLYGSLFVTGDCSHHINAQAQITQAQIAVPITNIWMAMEGLFSIAVCMFHGMQYKRALRLIFASDQHEQSHQPAGRTVQASL